MTEAQKRKKKKHYYQISVFCCCFLLSLLCGGNTTGKPSIASLSHSLSLFLGIASLLLGKIAGLWERVFFCFAAAVDLRMCVVPRFVCDS